MTDADKKPEKEDVNTVEIDGEIVQLRDKHRNYNEKEEKKTTKPRRSLRLSIRESFRNNALRRSLVRRVKSYEPQKERPRIKPKRSKTMQFFMSTVPRTLFNPLLIRV